MVTGKSLGNIKAKVELLYKIFICSPKVFSIPQKKDVLIYDACGADALMPYLKKYKTEILFVRGEKINIFCLMLAVLKVDFWRGHPLRAYADSYLGCVKPKICITFIDNNPAFYKLFSSLTGLITIFVQNGNRDNWLSQYNNNEGYRVDYMFVFNKHIGEIYSEKIEGEVIVIGSLKNNYVEKSNDSSDQAIIYISTFYPPDNGSESISVNGKSIAVTDFMKSEIILLEKLKNWCNENNKQLIVAGSCIGDAYVEESFYSKMLENCNWSFSPRSDIYSTYRLIDSAEIVVNIDSTMGYEALSRGKKTGFFCYRENFIERVSFGWPAKFSANGPFWTNETDDDNFNRVMNYLDQVEAEDWEQVQGQFCIELMDFNPGNSRFVGLLDELLKPE